MIQDRFQALLKQTIGLDANSIGVSAVMRAVESRARTCGIPDLQLYWDRVSDDSAELQALVEAVIVPETWFFRDREAFTAAVSLLRAKWQSRPAELPLRLLSLPCSTGEEPYTMAMALLDAGMAPSAIRINAIDISNQSLQHARTAIFGRNSFRGADLAFRGRHFTDTGQGYRISDAVQSIVQFSQGNIFALDRLADGSFDAVFCRNLLIYFDPADQRRATSVLGRLLAPTGTLFVGHSEASVLLSEGFTSLRIPQAFAFRKKDVSEKPAPDQLAKRPLKQKIAPPPPPPRFRSRVATKALAQPKPSPATKPSVTLDEIMQAADRGDLQVALQLGRNLLNSEPPSAETLYLLAVISEAAGDTTAAANYYRKTLYLNPKHDEALAHLALLLKRSGDNDGARRLGDRARRLGESKRAP